MNNSLFRSFVGVLFSVLAALSFLGLVLYAESWEASAVETVSSVGIASLTSAVLCFKWVEFKTLAVDFRDFCFKDDEDLEEEVEQFVDTSDTFVPYQSPWVLNPEKKKLPPAKVEW